MRALGLAAIASLIMGGGRGSLPTAGIEPSRGVELWWADGKKRGKSQLRRRRRARQARRAKARAGR